MKSSTVAKGALSVIALLILLALGGWLLLFRPVYEKQSLDAIENFNHGSIGNAAAQGIPYWIWRVLPVVFPELLPGQQDGYAALGFYWKAGEALPIGFSQQTIGVIPRVAFNCALCHQGSYRLEHQHKSTFVPGGAGTRVMPQSYQRFLLNSGQSDKFNADRIMAEIKKIYKMPLWERALYRYILIPFTRKALQDQVSVFAWMDTKPDWGPGRIDPFNPVKFNQLKLPVDKTIGNSDMMPLWDYQSVIEGSGRRYALHWDGLNTDLHEVAISGAIGDGMTYSSYSKLFGVLDSMEEWIKIQKPPASPFSMHLSTDNAYYVDPLAVAKGKQIYQQMCSDCHDKSGHRFRAVIPSVEIGTDRHRIDMWSSQAVERYTNYNVGGNWDFRHWQKLNGYVATELTGLWLKGPYLHNGSVPSLKSLLQPVAKRPAIFCRGLDVVDAQNGGFKTPEIINNTCQSTFYFDTQVPGNGNGGHEFGVNLPDNDKESLLSYLKTL